MDGCEWHDFINSNKTEHFSFCFAPVPKRYRLVQDVGSFIELDKSADTKHLKRLLELLTSQNQRGVDLQPFVLFQLQKSFSVTL